MSPHIGGQLTLVITDNRAVMISVRRDPRHRRYSARLHRIFVDAPDPIIRALARYVELNDRQASRQLGAFIDENDHRIDRPRRPGTGVRALRSSGRVYDLQQILQQLNRRYFDGAIDVAITWGRRVSPGRARRTVRLGSYCVEDNLIRIHPGLDKPWVPRFYIEWVVYHEMLHCVHPIPVVKGKRVFHSAAFAADERRFVDHDRVTVWERNNLAALLRI